MSERKASVKKVIVRHASGIESGVFANLERDGHLSVVHCFCHRESEEAEVAGFFRYAKISFTTQLFLKGLAGDFGDVDLRILTPEVLAGVSWAEPIALEMMDRIDPSKSLGYGERKNLYKYLLAYWLGEIERTKPDFYYSRSEPHEISDFVLFALCRHLGVGVRLFIYTSIPGVYLLAGDYRQPYGPLRERLRSLGDRRVEWEELGSKTRDRIQKIRGTYQAGVPRYFVDFIRQNQGQSEIFARVKTLSRNKLLGLKKKVLGPFTYAASRLGDAETKREFLMLAKREVSARLVRNDWKTLLPKYRSLASRMPDLTRPFVYFPLHYQPESSTCPMGGQFSDQVLVASILAACLPPGWKLYIKEHKSQFVDSPSGHIGRGVGYYDALATLPNVEFLPLAADPFELADKSRCVATITGTAGWEAVVRGKPALVFGDAWYQDAPNTYRIRDAKDCAQALREVSAGARTDEEALKRYLLAVEQLGIDLDFNEFYAKNTERPFDERKNSEVFKRAILGEENG